MSYNLVRSTLSRSLRLGSSRPSSSLTSSSSASSSPPAQLDELPPSITSATSTTPSPAPAPAPATAAGRVSSPAAAGQHLPTPALSPHTPIPTKHAIHVATLHLRSHTDTLSHLTFFTSFALRSARALGLPTSGAISLPTKTSLYTVPRSPFAHKKSQQNFWRKEHKRAIKVWDGNEEVVRAWLAYLRKEAMGGVGMKAQTFSYREVGWGEKMVEEQGQVAELGEGEAPEGEVEALARELMSELGVEVKEGEQEQREIEVEQGKKERNVLEEMSAEVEGDAV